MADETIPRRQFLVNAGVAGASLAGSAATAGLVPAAAEAQTAAVATDPGSPASLSTLPESALQYLNDAQHAFVVAAVDTLIPADELSPSGSECGCATYIDSWPALGVAVPRCIAPDRISKASPSKVTSCR